MTEAVAEKRKELVKQIIKGNYNLKEATIHPLAVLTPNDFKIIEKARNEKDSIELKKQQIKNRQRIIKKRKEMKNIFQDIGSKKFTMEAPYLPLNAQESKDMERDSPQNKKFLKVLSQNSLQIEERLKMLNLNKFSKEMQEIKQDKKRLLKLLVDTSEDENEKLQFTNQFLDSDDSEYFDANLGKFENSGDLNYLPPLFNKNYVVGQIKKDSII